MKLKGIYFVDSPVSGGRLRAEKGNLCSMVGGDDDIIEKVKPYIGTYSSKITHTGSVGTGHAVKAINNMLNVCNFSLASRGLIALKDCGVSQEVALDIINSSTGRSLQTEETIPKRNRNR